MGPQQNQCCICKEVLSGSVISDPWGNSAHLEHRPGQCGSCHRILSRYTSAGGYVTGDGRNICGLCKKNSVTDGVTANKSRRKVLDLLEKAGFQNIPKNVEIVLTHKQSLSNISNHPNTHGLTLTRSHFSEYKRVGMTHQIGILHGFPQIEFEGVMAHELLHVWQNENEVKFSPMYSEGLCNLGSFLVYAYEKSELALFLIDQLEKNPDPVYGNGYRLMKKRLEKAGSWSALIADVLAHKNGFEQSLFKKIFGR